MKKDKQKKRILLYIPFPCLLICMLSLLQAVDVSKVDLFYYCACLLIVAAGTAHLVALNKLISVHSFTIGFYITIVVMGLAAAIVLIVYGYASLNPGFMTFIFAFPIPYLMWHAYQRFLKIG